MKKVVDVERSSKLGQFFCKSKPFFRPINMFVL